MPNDAFDLRTSESSLIGLDYAGDRYPHMWFAWVGETHLRRDNIIGDTIGITREFRYGYCIACHNRIREDVWVRCPVESDTFCAACFSSHNHDGEYCGDCGYNQAAGQVVTECEECDAFHCTRHGIYHMHENDEIDSYDSRYDDHPPVRYWGNEASMQYIDEEYVAHPLARGKRAATAEIEVEYEGGSTETLNLGNKVGTHYDGSLDNGIEVTLPPSRGERLAKFMTDVCEKLTAGGYGVRETCGMHVHIDLRDKTEDKQFMSHLFNAFFSIEDIFYAMQKNDRQDNEYSIPLRRNYKFYEMYGQDVDSFDYNFYKQEKNENGKRIMESEKTRKYGAPRYAAFNFHSVYFRGSLEVRIHEGNVDPIEALNWIDLIQFVIARVERSHSYKYMDMLVRGNVTQEKVKKFFRYFQIPQDLRRWVVKRIENGQGFGYTLGDFQWGTPKRGRPKKVEDNRTPFINQRVQCGRCSHAFTMRRTLRRCPNCNRNLFDFYGAPMYHQSWDAVAHSWFTVSA